MSWRAHILHYIFGSGTARIKISLVFLVCVCVCVCVCVHVDVMPHVLTKSLAVDFGQNI